MIKGLLILSLPFMIRDSFKMTKTGYKNILFRLLFVFADVTIITTLFLIQ